MRIPCPTRTYSSPAVPSRRACWCWCWCWGMQRRRGNPGTLVVPGSASSPGRSSASRISAPRPHSRSRSAESSLCCCSSGGGGGGGGAKFVATTYSETIPPTAHSASTDIRRLSSRRPRPPPLPSVPVSLSVENGDR